MERRGALRYGQQVSLQFLGSEGFVTSLGAADPRVHIRLADDDGIEADAKFLAFDDSVWIVQTPPNTAFAEAEGHVLYGSRVCFQHARSGWYLALLAAHAAQYDINCHAVMLVSPENVTSTSHFKVQPRYKVHAEGDRIASDDQITIQLFDKQLFVHVSDSSNLSSSISVANIEMVDATVAFVEVNGSGVAATFTILTYDRPQDTNTATELRRRGKKPIYCGTPVVVFHREREAVLVHQASVRPSDTTASIGRRRGGSIASATFGMSASRTRSASSLVRADGPCFEAHTTFREDVPFEDDSTVSCSALWIVEALDPRIGGLVKFDGAYRLRHAATNTYLALDAQSQLRVIEQPRTASELQDSVFVVRSFFNTSERNGRVVTDKEFVRLQHRRSGRWINTIDESSGTKRSSSSDIVVEADPQSHDAIAIGTANVELQRNVAFLFQMGEYLQRLCRAYVLRQVPAADSFANATHALTALIRFCSVSDDDNPLTREGLPDRQHQQIMFDLKLHHTLFRLLTVPFTSVAGTSSTVPQPPLVGGLVNLKSLTDESHAQLHSVCRLGYRLLRQMIKNNGVCGAMLADFIPVMHNQDGLKLHVADTMLALFTDNPHHSPAVFRAAAEHYVKLLTSKSRSAGYLKFIAAMCSVSGRPSPDNQRLVCKLLLQDHPEVLIEMPVTKAGVAVRVVGKNEEPRDIPLDEFLISFPDAKLVKFFEAQIDLLATLCLGTCTDVITHVQRFVGVQHVETVARGLLATTPSYEAASRLDATRANFVLLALNLFIRRDFGDIDVTLRSTTPLACGSALIHKSECMSGVSDTPLMGSMKSVTLRILTSNMQLIAENPARNRLLATVLELWSTLVEYRQYSAADAKELLPCITELLDWRKDELSTKRNRHEKTWDRLARSELNVILMDVRRRCCDLLRMLVVDATRIHAQEIVEGMKDTMCDLVEAHAATIEEQFDSRTLVPLLLNIAQYDDPPTVATAMETLACLVHVRRAMARIVFQAKVVVDGSDVSVKFFDSLYYVSRELRKALDSGVAELDDALALLLRIMSSGHVPEGAADIPGSYFSSREDESSEPASPGSPRMLARMGSISSFKLEQRSRSASSSKWGSARAVLKVMSLSKSAQKRRSIEDEVPHALIRRTEAMAHWKIHEPLLAKLAQLPTTHKAYPALIEFFFHFALSAQNAVLLVPHLHLFLGGLGHSLVSQHCMYIVVSIMSADKQSTGVVDRELLKKLVELVEHEAHEATPKSAFIRLLNRSIIGTQLIPANQRFLLHRLHQKRIFANVHECTADWPGEKLAFCTSLVTLMSNCCTGNASSRHLGQRILPSVAILNILLRRPRLPIQHRTPFLRFLTGVYFTFEDESPHERAQLCTAWMNKPEVWDTFSLMIGDMREALGSLRTQSAADFAPHRDYVFVGMLGTLLAFFRDIYAFTHSKPEKVVVVIGDVANAVLEITEALLRNAKNTTVEVSVSEWGVVRRLIAQLLPVLEELEFSALADSFVAAQPRIEAMTLNEEGDQSGSDAEGEEVQVPYDRLYRRLLRERDALTQMASPHGNTVLRSFIEWIAVKSKAVDKCVTHVFDCLKATEFTAQVTATLLTMFTHALRTCEDLGVAEMVALQDRIDELGAMNVVTTLTEVVDDAIVESALAFGVAILEGGNASVQDRMLAYFETFDERFFHNIRDIIVSATTNTKHENRLRRQQQLQTARSVSLAFSMRFVGDTFRLLQLMCEGHHLGMQNYVREQTDNLHSINILKDVVALMEELCSYIDKSNVVVVTQGFALFSEFCQGPCRENQLALLTLNVCGLICRAFDFRGAAVSEIDALKAAAATTALSLIEGCNDATVYAQVLKQIPVSIIAQQMKATVAGSPEWASSGEDDPAVDLLFNLLIFLKQVEPFADDERRSEIEQALRSFHAVGGLLGSIEIERGSTLERVFFRIPSICVSLTEKSRNALLWAVDRSTRSSKLKDFFDKSDELIFEMETAHAFEMQLKRLSHFVVASHPEDPPENMSRVRLPVWNVTRRIKASWNTAASTVIKPEIDFYDTITFLCASVINIMVAFTSIPEGNILSTLPLIELLGVVLLFAAVAALVIDSCVYLPVKWYQQEKARSRTASMAVSETEPDESDAHEPVGTVSRIKSFSTRHREKIITTATRMTTVYRTVLVVTALLALTASRYFYAFHLATLIDRSTVLRNVIVAITQNGKSLLLTMGLGVVVVYAFSIVGLSWFPEAYTDEDVDAEDANCSTLARCFVFILIHGLRQGGGIGDAMRTVKWSDPSHTKRLIYDFLFFAVMNVVFLNILFGIIIDTFAELRDDKKTKEEDMNSTCFICGLSSDTFDKAAVEGFETHIEREHNIWQYLYFMHHLRRKDPNEYNGQESFVAELLGQNDLSFFPLERAMSLEQRGGPHKAKDNDVDRGNATPSDDEDDDTPSSLAGLAGEVRSLLQNAATSKHHHAVVTATAATNTDGLSDAMRVVELEAQLFAARQTAAQLQDELAATRSIANFENDEAPPPAVVASGTQASLDMTEVEGYLMELTDALRDMTARYDHVSKNYATACRRLRDANALLEAEYAARGV